MLASATGTSVPSRLTSSMARGVYERVRGSLCGLLLRAAAGLAPGDAVHARPVSERVGLERARERVALAHVAAELGEPADDVGRLGALGDDREAERVRQLDRRQDDLLVVAHLLHARHERAVDLELGQRQVAEAGSARGARGVNAAAAG